MISIVSTFFNRRGQLIATLKSIQRSSVKDFEFIVVDDGSDEDHRIEDLVGEFKFLEVIRVEPQDKWYRNPCIPYNLGFAASRGDKIIIQNSECLHLSDILFDVQNTLDEQSYLSYGVYSVDPYTTSRIIKDDSGDLRSLIYFDNYRGPMNGENCWYNHGIYRPCAFHFCNAISRANLIKLNGFDEDYAPGICYDDNEFLFRVKNLGLDINFRNDYIAVHQYHENFNYNKSDSRDLEYRNFLLYQGKTTQSQNFTANPLKQIIT